MVELHLINIRLQKVSIPSKFLYAVWIFSAIENSLFAGADVAVSPKKSLANTASVESSSDFFLAKHYILDLHQNARCLQQNKFLLSVIFLQQLLPVCLVL